MNPWLVSAITVFSLISIVYLLSRIFKRNDLMDVFWGIGFSLLTISNAVVFIDTQKFNTAKFVLIGLISAWSLRLSLHIIIKNWVKLKIFVMQTGEKNGVKRNGGVRIYK